MMRKWILLLIVLFIKLSTLAQLANIDYTIKLNSVTTYNSNCNDPCVFCTATAEYTAFVNATDNVNGTASSTGCLQCDAAGNCTYGANAVIRNQTNTQAYTAYITADAWEDDQGSRCSYSSNCCDGDDCRFNGTLVNPNIRELVSPSATYATLGTFGNGNHSFSIALTWKYNAASANITPSCTAQTVSYSAGGIRSWAVSLTAGVIYNFNNCGSTTEDTYMRLYAIDGYTVTAFADDGCSLQSNLTFTPTTSGMYYIELAKYNGGTNRDLLTSAGTLTYSIVTPTLGTLSNAGPINFCDAGGNFGTALSVSGQTGTVVWDWGSNNGVWNIWLTSNSSGVCCFPKKTSNNDGNADRIRYRVVNGACSVTSGTVLIVNRYNEAPSSLAVSSPAYCSNAVPANITLTATFPSSINKNGTVAFYSGSCGGTLLGAVTAGDNTSTATLTITSPTSSTTYYARYEPGTGTSCSNTACVQTSVTVTVPPTNPGSGVNTWNVIGYNGNDVNLGGTAVYKGYYTEPLLTYQSINRWGTNASPSSASGWVGCPVDIDNHTVVSKRTGVPTNGVYAVSVNQHDDNFQFYVGGINQFEEAYCCLTHTDVYTGYMDGTTTLEMRHGEGAGGSNQGLTFVQQNLSASVSKTDLAENAVCNGNTGTLTFSNPTGVVASPVFRSNFSTSTGLTTSGNASVTSGYLQLTPNAGSQTGGAIFTNTTNMNASIFRSEFDFRVWDGGGADGFSFNYADMSSSPANNGELGFGNGLSVCFITYSGAGGPFVQIKYAGAVVGSNVGVTIRDASFRKCVLTVNTSNQLSLSIAGAAVITNLALPAAFQSIDKTNWKFSFAGRTGGVTDSHQIDNLVINAYNQYEYSINGTTWNSTGVFTGLAAGTYTPRIRNKAFTAYPVSLTNVTITQPAAPAQGTAGTYGTNEWYVSCYNANNFTGYRGFYKSARSNEFNIGADGMGATSNPASIVTGTINGATVTGYSGCSISNVDNWSLDARRTGFTCGVYQLEVMGNDDSYTIEIDYDGNGSTDISRTGACCNGTSLGLVGASPYILNSSSKIKITFVEGTGDAYLDVNFNTITPATLNGGTIAGITNGINICTGGDPGTFSTSGTASGGAGTSYLNGAYTYDWESSITSASAGFSSLGIASQTYDPNSLTATTWFRRKVTDKCGTIAYSNVMQVVVVADPTAPSNTATPTATTVCIGTNLSIVASGSTGGTGTCVYEYAIDPGTGVFGAFSTNNTITATTIGNGTYRIKSRRNCNGTGCDISPETIRTWTVVPTISLTPSGTNVSCFGGSNGTASVLATGGTGTYTYAWSTGGSSSSISSLPIGTYTVLVTSANCSATTAYTVTQPTALSASLSNVVHDLCQLGLGAVQITATGGTPPYIISKNPINTGTFSPSNTINTNGGQTYIINIPGGSTLSVIATDSKGCIFP